MANPRITEELVTKWFGNVNVRGWVMTIQGHPIFAIGKGPFNSKLLSEDAYDKHDNSKTAKHLQDLAYSKKYFFIGKSSKLSRYTDNRLIELYTPVDTWPYRHYSDRYRTMEKIEDSEAFKNMWERCLSQVQSINIQTDMKKGVAINYIRGMLDPVYVDTKRKFKLTDDECLQAFEDAIELLKVKMVMNA
jgi:hypothetical protein